MRCKQGDLAIVIRSGQPEFIGVPCRVVSLGEAYRHIASGTWMVGWNVEFSRDMPWSRPAPNGRPLNTGWLPDEWLKPIRDPGEDAVDQMVLRLGKPARSPLAKVCDPQPVVVGAPTHGEVG